jgi:hypothetical protein
MAKRKETRGALLLRQVTVERGVAQRISERCNVNRATVSRWKKAERVPLDEHQELLVEWGIPRRAWQEPVAKRRAVAA